MQLGYIWLFIAVILGIAEAVTVSLVSIWFVLGALAAFLSSFFIHSFFIQFIIFTVISVASLIITKPLIAKYFIKTPQHTNADRVIGKTAIVVEDIMPLSSGRVKVDGLLWLATCDVPLSKGDECLIEKIEGVTLVVSPIKITI